MLATTKNGYRSGHLSREWDGDHGAAATFQGNVVLVAWSERDVLDPTLELSKINSSW